MDLASPSPAPEQEPHIIGAWSDFSSSCSSSESDSIATPPDNQIVAIDNETAETPAVAVNTAAVEHEESHEAVTNEDAPSTSPIPSADKGKQKEQTPAIDTSAFASKSEYEELKFKYSSLQTEIDVLQAQRRKYKSKFNANVHTVSDKFHELEDKMNDMTAQCTLFMDQIEGVTSGDIPEMQARIDDLVDDNYGRQLGLDDLTGRIERWEDRVDEKNEEIEDLKEDLKEEKARVGMYLDTLKGLIDEMKTLRATTEREVAAELATLRQLRETILQEQNTSSPTKRKRSLDDEGDRDTDELPASSTSSPIVTLPTSALDNGEPMHGVENNFPFSCDIEDTQYGLGFQIHHDRPSPRKRARRIASVAAQTATAVTMGAVAAWVALAFS
ncbi:hypothetical protein NP233_g9267 [Leucocoprinus birnbaumii]|uniref:Uncharacterized protein n=1 Tax=Leucocoprinus birnbaumii TaxID=56174 RepID=A0AAD5VLC1_9AGAR|nr:hypothetical protein NP233_g9267 [Leucocoprinus birnbaumii]